MKKFIKILKEYPVEIILARMLWEESDIWEDGSTRRKNMKKGSERDALLPLYYGLYRSMVEEKPAPSSSSVYILTGFRRDDMKAFGINICEINRDAEGEGMAERCFDDWNDICISKLYIPERLRDLFRAGICDLDVICSIIHIICTNCVVEGITDHELFERAREIYRSRSLAPGVPFNVSYLSPYIIYGRVLYEEEIFRECRKAADMSYITWNVLLKNGDFIIEFCKRFHKISSLERERYYQFDDDLTVARIHYFLSEAGPIPGEIVITDPVSGSIPKVSVENGNKGANMADYEPDELYRMHIHTETMELLEYDYAHALLYLNYLCPDLLSGCDEERVTEILSSNIGEMNDYLYELYRTKSPLFAGMALYQTPGNVRR